MLSDEGFGMENGWGIGVGLVIGGVVGGVGEVLVGFYTYYIQSPTQYIQFNLKLQKIQLT